MTGHLYLDKMPVVSERPVWSLEDLKWPGHSVEGLTNFLVTQSETKGAEGLLLWLFRAGVVLADAVGVQATESEQAAFARRSPRNVASDAKRDLRSTSQSVAEAVMQWFSQ
jgi:hypothetical protein